MQARHRGLDGLVSNLIEKGDPIDNALFFATQAGKLKTFSFLLESDASLVDKKSRAERLCGKQYCLAI